MVLETLENERFVSDALLLYNFKEVLVDLVVVNTSDSSNLSGFSFSLSEFIVTSSSTVSWRVLSSLRSMSELMRRLSFLSKDSIYVF